MNHLRSLGKRISILFLLAFAIPAASETLEEAFHDPPREYSIAPFWAWNGTLEPDELRRQIDEMLDKGIYGAFMHARAGIESCDTPYFSEGWWKAVETCVTYGAEKGFSPWLYDEDKWPSGSAGGRVLERNPERNRQKALRLIRTYVTGPADIPISFPEANYVIAGQITGPAQLDGATLTDLTALNSPQPAGSKWACPPGAWLIIAYALEPYHDGVNYLNAETVRDFIDITHEEYARRFGTHFGTTIPGVFFDEIMNDAGKSPDHHVWAENFERRFRELKGYDLPPLLPALSQDIGPATPKIRCDYYDVYTTLYEEAWFKQIADWCAEHGIKLTGHTVESLNRYMTQGDYMRTMRHLQIPLTDNEDFRYTWPRTIGAWKPKQAASIAHLYGWPRAGAEALGAAGWPFTLDMARYGFNMLNAYGVTFFVPHCFAYAIDKPANMDDWPPSWFFRNPYWKYFKTLADHVRRTSFMLSGGEPVVDAAVLYPQCNLWAGYGAGTTEETVELLTAALLDVDLIDPPSLLGAGIEGGALLAGRARYRALIVPDLRCLRRTEADQIRRFAESGGLVVIHENWPVDSAEEGRGDPYLRDFRVQMEALGTRLARLEDTAARIESVLGRDIEIMSGPRGALRYSHVRKDRYEIYWLTNGAQEAGQWRIRFRATGAPSLWDPETGATTPISSFLCDGEFTECGIALDAWQGHFAVFNTQSQPPEGGVLATSESLRDIEIDIDAPQDVTISGWTPAYGEVTIEGYMARSASKTSFSKCVSVEPAPPPVPLGGDWTFLAVGARLDNDWTVDINEASLEIPVARIRWERNTHEDVEDWRSALYNDNHWRQVKILDTLHAQDGAKRYQTRWDGHFITYSPYQTFDLQRFFLPVIGGKGLQCRKTFTLGREVTGVRMAVVCPGPFKVFVNDMLRYTGQGGADAEGFEFSGVRPGENILRIVADDAPALLAEGAFIPEYGAPTYFSTGAEWQAAIEGKEWREAWEYVAPPESPYGEPRRPFHTELPDTVWYRVTLPPGTAAIQEPKVEGHCEVWLDGSPLPFHEGWAQLPAALENGVLAIRVTLGENDHGLMAPVIVRCVPISMPLGSWTGRNLDWYSGRAMYSRDFSLGQAYFGNDLRIELDLGKVAFCAEVWVNGRLAGVRPWPPYRLDITPYLKAGENRLDVVAANLIANRMRWDIFDDVKGNLQSRKWHDDGILRDAWCLESGLIGPVTLTTLRRLETTIGPQDRP